MSKLPSILSYCSRSGKSSEELLSDYEVLLARQTRSGLKPELKQELVALRHRIIERMGETSNVIFSLYEVSVIERARKGGLKPSQQLAKAEARKQLIERMEKKHS